MNIPGVRSSGPAPGRRAILWAAALFVGLVTLPAQAAAQDHRFSITGYLGSAGYSNLADGEDPGVMLDPSGFYGVQAEFWFGRFGARLHTGFADTQLEQAPDTGFAILAIDADFLARLRRPRPGQIFQPYGVLGFGVVRYNTGTDATTVAGYDYGRDPENRATMVLGIGADFGGGPAAVRLELMDIIGFSSPLAGSDGSDFGPVSHVVLTLGLSFRVGHIELPTAGPPQPTRLAPRPRPTRPVQPADTARADTARADTAAGDTLPAGPGGIIPVDTTRTDTTPSDQLPAGPGGIIPVDTTGGVVPADTGGGIIPADTVAAPADTTAPDTIRTPFRPPRRPPRDTAGPPTDTGPEDPVVVRPPVDTAGPPTRPPPVDTSTEPIPDTTPADSIPRGPVGPPDTADARVVETPADTTDTGRTRGRLFAVRIAWDPRDPVQATAAASLLAVLEEAGVPTRPSRAGPGDDAALSYRRAATLRDAAHARTLVTHVTAARTRRFAPRRAPRRSGLGRI